MRTRIWADWSGEVEVEISPEELQAVFSAKPGEGETWFTLLNRYACAMRALPDTLILTWTSGQRSMIREFFLTQAQRFEDVETPQEKGTSC